MSPGSSPSRRVFINCVPKEYSHGVATRADLASRISQLHREYDGNFVSTTKYNLLTFFPKSLFEQYRRIANIYFTAAALLSTTPYSPVAPFTTIA